MILALRTLTQSRPTGTLTIHPGEEIKDWDRWAVTVRRALINQERVADVPSKASLIKDARGFRQRTQLDDPPTPQDETQANTTPEGFMCTLCPDRSFRTQTGLRMHTTKAHKGILA